MNSCSEFNKVISRSLSLSMLMTREQFQPQLLPMILISVHFTQKVADNNTKGNQPEYEG